MDLAASFNSFLNGKSGTNFKLVYSSALGVFFRDSSSGL